MSIVVKCNLTVNYIHIQEAAEEEPAPEAAAGPGPEQDRNDFWALLDNKVGE